MTAGSATRAQVADYALIGDCETAALVRRDATIAWLCWPRFDSEACFASLLGGEENGGWRIAAADPDARLSRAYEGESMILETRIETAEGAVRLLDFMPVRGAASDVVRMVVGERGRVRLRSELRLRFDYGRLRPRWRTGDDGCAHAVSGPHGVRLATDVPVGCPPDGDCVAEFEVAAGERRAFVLTYYVSHGAPPARVDPRQALEDTRAFWADWCGRCAYQGPHREAVVRSLAVMKAMTYRPSGAILAAPTSSLPERPGGTRNWDYRFCWLRDATFTLLAFLQAGYDEEAAAWRDWLLRAVAGDPARAQPVYGLAGEPRLTEWEADWLSGFAGSRPVRFGNAAFLQQQLDVCGEVIDALHHAHGYGLAPDPDAWRMAAAMVEHLEQVWRQPDAGIWETRGPLRRFTFSQAMIWVALDRVVRRADDVGAGPAAVERWTALRERIRGEIFERGFDPASGAFVRDFDSRELDASLLLLPQIGLLQPDDPRLAATLAAIERRLVEGAFVFRYDDEAMQDGLPKGQAAFLPCSFWYADALHITGRPDEARRVFEQVLAVRSDLGLLSEEYDTGAGLLVGNFPQALSHLALVNTAFRLFQPGAGRGEQGLS